MGSSSRLGVLASLVGSHTKPRSSSTTTGVSFLRLPPESLTHHVRRAFGADDDKSLTRQQENRRFRRAPTQPSLVSLVWVSAVVVVGGMLFAKVAANSGLPTWVYYGIPAVTTVFLPPVVFGMRRGEVAAYICAAGLMPAVIHVSFSFILGWKEYLPFWAVPSLRELLS